jgi:hypothetical protein
MTDTIKNNLQKLLEANKESFKFLIYVFTQIADTGGVWDGGPRKNRRPGDKMHEENLVAAGLLEQAHEQHGELTLTPLGWAVGFQAWRHHAYHFANMSTFEPNYDAAMKMLLVIRMLNGEEVE